MNINGRVQAGHGRPGFGRGRVRASCCLLRDGRTPLSATAMRKCALAVTALTLQVTLSWAIVNFQPLPLSVVTLSDDQMAKIKG